MAKFKIKPQILVRISEEGADAVLMGMRLNDKRKHKKPPVIHMHIPREKLAVNISAATALGALAGANKANKKHENAIHGAIRGGLGVMVGKSLGKDIGASLGLKYHKAQVAAGEKSIPSKKKYDAYQQIFGAGSKSKVSLTKQEIRKLRRIHGGKLLGATLGAIAGYSWFTRDRKNKDAFKIEKISMVDPITVLGTTAGGLAGALKGDEAANEPGIGALRGAAGGFAGSVVGGTAGTLLGATMGRALSSAKHNVGRNLDTLGGAILVGVPASAYGAYKGYKIMTKKYDDLMSSNSPPYQLGKNAAAIDLGL